MYQSRLAVSKKPLEETFGQYGSSVLYAELSNKNHCF